MLIQFLIIISPCHILGATRQGCVFGLRLAKVFSNTRWQRLMVKEPEGSCLTSMAPIQGDSRQISPCSSTTIVQIVPLSRSKYPRGKGPERSRSMACRRLASQPHSTSETSNANVASSSHTVGTGKLYPWSQPFVSMPPHRINHQMEVGGQNNRCLENTAVPLRSDQYKSALLPPCGLKLTVGDSWVRGKTSYHVTT